MIFYGVQKTSLINYPDKISLVLFTGGCNLNCRYCYNKELVYTLGSAHTVSEDEAIKLIQSRSSFIDAVVITGGEPAIHKDLPDFLQTLRDTVSLRIKLDTNGFHPDILEDIIKRNLIDFIAVDIKTSPEKYASLVDTKIDIISLQKSIELIKESKLKYEFRSTIVPGFFEDEDIVSINNLTGRVEQYNLQQYVNESTIDSSYTEIHPLPKRRLFEIQKKILTFAKRCSVRGI